MVASALEGIHDPADEWLITRAGMEAVAVVPLCPGWQELLALPGAGIPAYTGILREAV
jgi:hypothetical protein